MGRGWDFFNGKRFVRTLTHVPIPTKLRIFGVIMEAV